MVHGLRILSRGTRGGRTCGLDENGDVLVPVPGVAVRHHHLPYEVRADLCVLLQPVGWLVPIPDKTAERVAKALLRIFCECASFPTVLRSDNAAEFIGDVVKHLNKMLAIKHITGSSYHPQSQGAVESMHKTLNQYVRGILQGDAEKWEPWCTRL